MSLDLRWILTSCQTHLIISGQVSEDQLVSCRILTLTSLQPERQVSENDLFTYLQVSENNLFTYLSDFNFASNAQSHKCHASEDELFRWNLPSCQTHLVT